MKKKYKLVMKVPKTPKHAYNHNRFISSLIEHQVKHFHEMEKSLLKPGEKLTDVSKIKTELHASKYLKKMTALMHPQGAAKPATPTGAAKKPKLTKRKTTSKENKRKR